jgi:uncharacterized membrane protein
MLSLRIHSVVLASAFIALLCTNAWAYLDPGTGSYLFQVVVGMLVGAAYALKLYWLRVRTFFSALVRRFSKADSGNS